MTTQSTPQCVSSNCTWPQAARMARGVAHTNLETLKEGRRLPFPHHATPGNALTYQQYGVVYECSVLAALSIRREGDGGVALKSNGRRGSCSLYPTPSSSLPPLAHHGCQDLLHPQRAPHSHVSPVLPRRRGRPADGRWQSPSEPGALPWPCPLDPDCAQGLDRTPSICPTRESLSLLSPPPRA